MSHQEWVAEIVERWVGEMEPETTTRILRAITEWHSGPAQVAKVLLSKSDDAELVWFAESLDVVLAGKRIKKSYVNRKDMKKGARIELDRGMAGVVDVEESYSEQVGDVDVVIRLRVIGAAT